MHRCESCFILRSPRFLLCTSLVLSLLLLSVYMLREDKKVETEKTPKETLSHEEQRLQAKKTKQEAKQVVELEKGKGQSWAGQALLRDGNWKGHVQIPREVTEKQPDSDVKEKLDGGFSKSNPENEVHVIDVYFALTSVNFKRDQLFSQFCKSLLRYTQSHLRIHAVVDKSGQSAVSRSIPTGTTESGATVDIQLYNVNEISRQVEPVLKSLRQHFSAGQRSYYHSPIFFLPIALHQILSDSIKKIIVLDTDMEFRTDVKSLYAMFERFSATNIMGLAHEQQPVYRHVFYSYRRKTAGTLVGAPPSSGLTGFNSGCVLMDLEKMRQSVVYKQALQGALVKSLAEKYKFHGHLGDQDFYTLLSLEHSELFFVLPCTWNRQLCVWWRDHGYKIIFDEYHNCAGDVNLYHGNCNTPIPQEDSQ